MIKNLIFDIGSVLVAFDYHKYFSEKYHDLDLEKQILAESLYNPIWQKFDLGIDPEEKTLKEIKDTYPNHAKEIQAFYDDIPHMVYEYAYSSLLIKKLKEKGYKVYLLSNFGKVHFEMLVEKMKFVQLVDGMAISYREKMIKPNTEFFDLLINRYGLKKEESLFIDDRLVNVLAGNKAGIKSIQFFSLPDLEEKLTKLEIL